MSDRFTAVRLPYQMPGRGWWAERGRHSVEHMIAAIRERAKRDKEIAEQILEAKDSDFLVETYLGAHAQRKLVVLQKPVENDEVPF